MKKGLIGSLNSTSKVTLMYILLECLINLADPYWEPLPWFMIMTSYL